MKKEDKLLRLLKALHTGASCGCCAFKIDVDKTHPRDRTTSSVSLMPIMVEMCNLFPDNPKPTGALCTYYSAAELTTTKELEDLRKEAIADVFRKRVGIS